MRIAFGRAMPRAQPFSWATHSGMWRSGGAPWATNSTGRREGRATTPPLPLLLAAALTTAAPAAAAPMRPRLWRRVSSLFSMRLNLRPPGPGHKPCWTHQAVARAQRSVAEAIVDSFAQRREQRAPPQAHAAHEGRAL